MLQVLNVEALSRASVAFVGEEMTRKILALYSIIDKATHDGYQLGLYEAEQGIEARLDAAFDNGWELGHDEGEAEGIAERGPAWDEGYIEGVTDARRWPAIADETVAQIISESAQFALNGEYDAELVTDSGDETD
jgi:hypothetical protein